MKVRKNEKLKKENEDLKKIQDGAKKKITVEVKNLVNNQVKRWREEWEKNKIDLRGIFEQEMKQKENVKIKIIKVIKTKNNIVRDAAENKNNVIIYGLKEKTISLRIKGEKKRQ